MDTYARRHLWEMVKKYKKGRLIILTTHNMDEADFLGDRIGIMSEGQMVTCGSPIFLKKRFGDGYELTIIKSADATEQSTEKLRDLVLNSVENSKVISEIGSEIKFRLPDGQAGFQGLFQAMEQNQQGLGIQSFGIDMNTLEDVFIKVARIATGRQPEQLPFSQGSTLVHRLESPGSQEDKMQSDDPMSMDLKKLTELNPNHTGQQLKALLRKRYLNVVRDWGTLVCEILMPIVTVIIGLGIAKIRFFTPSPILPVTPAIYPDTRNFTANSLGPDLQTDPVRALLTNFNPGVFAFNQTSPTSLYDFNFAIYNQNNTNQLFSFYFSSVTSTFVNYTLLFNTTAPFAPFMAVNQLTNAILTTFQTTNPAAAVPIVNFILEPLGLTKGYSSLNATASGFIVVILIIQAFALIPNSLIQFIVKERENNSKHQQVVSGTDVRVYWLSNFIVDYVKYLIPGLFIYAMFFAFGADFFYAGDKAGYTIVLIMLYGIPLILVTYCLSFLFTSPGNAQIVVFILFSFVSMVLVILSFALKLIESTRDVGLNVLPYIFNLVSPFSFGDAFMNMANDFLYSLFFSWKTIPGPFDTRIGGTSLIYLAVFSFFYLGLLMVIEYWYVITKGLRPARKQPKLAYEPGKWRSEASASNDRMNVDQGIDEDVLAEEEAVKKKTKAFSLYVEDLKKVYNVPGNGLCSGYFKKKAVNGVTFGVEQGSVFCLLGTNGAGKTTTFKILTGDISATEGNAVIRGHTLPEDLGVIRQLVGYCPQFDSLSDKLTTQEHLELYCDLKGIHPKYQTALIENMIASLNLTPYRHVQSETYSGGNKRKLSIAIALIGQPPIVFLDEPSAGMDPEARRFMWNFIAEISNKRSQSSIVLTTHSMEEAQALSNKVGIMVEGKLKTIGTTQRLKEKYGKGFEVEIKLNLPSEELLAALTESYRNMVKFKRPDVMTEDELKVLLQKIGRPELIAELVDGGRGSAIRQRLKATGEVEETTVVEWVRLQNELTRVEQALKGSFEVALIEAYQSYAKFNISAKHRLSEIFGFFERDLQNLNVANFAVRALSLEQIFLQFAQGIVHED
jgi:ATP-binding cassette subfamily A (ABC1) protein 3